MPRRINEIRQFSPVLDRHWTNILIVGLQLPVGVQSHPIDNVRRTTVISSEGFTRLRRALLWLRVRVAPGVLNPEHQMLEYGLYTSDGR